MRDCLDLVHKIRASCRPVSLQGQGGVIAKDCYRTVEIITLFGIWFNVTDAFALFTDLQNAFFPIISHNTQPVPFLNMTAIEAKCM